MSANIFDSIKRLIMLSVILLSGVQCIGIAMVMRQLLKTEVNITYHVRVTVNVYMVNGYFNGNVVSISSLVKHI